MHCFTMGSKKYDPLTWEANREQTFTTKYYNEGIQKAAFALPNFVKDYLAKLQYQIEHFVNPLTS